MQKGFGLIGILIVVGIIAILGVGALKVGFSERNPFIPADEEKSAIEMAEQVKNVMEEKNTEMVANDDATKDETADWKTYRNEEYGFEFKYPPEINFNEPNLSFYLGGEGNILIDVANANSELGQIYKDSELDENRISLNGQTAWQIKGRGTANFYFIETYVNQNQYVYHIQYSGPNEHATDI